MKRNYKIDGGSIWMGHAERIAEIYSLDLKQKVGCVIVHDKLGIIGCGANGSRYHELNGCLRKVIGCKSGEGYDLCEGCHPKNHAEPSAIDDALSKSNGDSLRGSDVYIWGHWWCCSACWSRMDEVGIRDVYIIDGAEERFRP